MALLLQVCWCTTNSDAQMSKCLCTHRVNLYPYGNNIGTRSRMSTEKDAQTEISIRLREAISAKGMKLSSAAELCEIPYRSFQNYTLGLREPNADALKAISSRLNISSDWLLTGTGPMLRDGGTPATGVAGDPREAALLALFRDMDEEGRREIQAAAQAKKRLSVIEQRIEELATKVARLEKSA